MKRRTARRAAFTLIFQIPFHSAFDHETAYENYISIFGVSNPDAYVFDTLKGVCENLQNIDVHIQKSLSNWDIDRVCRTDLAILRQSVYELRDKQSDTPPAVTINEAVEIAKAFGTDESGSFVNGVLSAALKLL